MASAMLVSWSRIAPARDGPPLAIGVLPNLSPRVLVARYQPLGRYLERVLARPVHVQTANGWRGFHERAVAGDYDLIVTAAHLARLGQLEAGLVPLARLLPPIRALLVHAAGEPIVDRAALRGQTIALSNPASLVALRGVRWLEEAGLVRGRDFRIVGGATDDSLGAMILRGEARAAIVSDGEFRAIPAPERDRLDVHAAFAEVPGFVLMAPPRLGPEAIDLLSTTLLGLDGRDEDGRQFFSGTGFTAITEVPGVEMQALDADLDDARRLLAGLA